MWHTALRFMCVILITCGDKSVNTKTPGSPAPDTGMHAVQAAEIANVVFPSGAKAERGNTLSPSQVEFQPLVTWDFDRVDYCSWCTLCLLEPHDEKGLAENNLMGYKHWLVGNIPTGFNVSDGQTLTEYDIGLTINDLAGKHDYWLFVFGQPTYLDFGRYYSEQKNFIQSLDFNLKKFAEEFKLNGPIFNNSFWVGYKTLDEGVTKDDLTTMSENATNKESSNKEPGQKHKSQMKPTVKNDSQDPSHKNEINTFSSSEKLHSKNSSSEESISKEPNYKESNSDKSSAENSYYEYSSFEEPDYSDFQDPNEISSSEELSSEEQSSEEKSSEEQSYEEQNDEEQNYEKQSSEKPTETH